MIIKTLFHSKEEQNTLSGTEYFDFYSTLVKIHDNLKKPKVKIH